MHRHRFVEQDVVPELSHRHLSQQKPLMKNVQPLHALSIRRELHCRAIEEIATSAAKFQRLQGRGQIQLQKVASHLGLLLGSGDHVLLNQPRATC